MKILVSWLADHLDLGELSKTDELISALTRFGIEVEETQESGGQTVLELEITANRSDLLCHYGIARELSASLGKKLQPSPDSLSSDIADSGDFLIEIQTDNCSRYSGLVINGVKIAPSSEHVSSRLDSLGLRPINNVVDATNYALFDLNHPVHAFDLDKLDGKIVVRQAEAGEKITLLDGNEYELNPHDMVIADASKAVALAGVMGGLDTAVTEVTTNILLEAAYFNPTSVRKTARRFGISSDSSYRFERGADPQAPSRIVRYLANLVMKEAGGSPSGGVIDITRLEYEPVTIIFRKERVKQVLGFEVEDQTEIFKKIGCSVDGGNVVPPSWRNDLQREIDLIEEVARFGGFDNIPTSLPALPGVTADFNAALKTPVGQSATRFREFRLSLANTLKAFGFDHCFTFTFESEKFGEAIISNPLNESLNRMRSTLIPGLCRMAQVRLDKAGTREIRVFELEKTFKKKIPEETYALAALAGGAFESQRYDGRKEDTSTLDHMLGVLEAIGRSVRTPLVLGDVAENTRADFYEDARVVLANGKPVGKIGTIIIEKVVSDRSKTSSQVNNFYGLEIDLLALFEILQEVGTKIQYRPLPQFPSSERDMAFVVDAGIEVGKIVSAVQSGEAPFLEGANLFDIFVMKGKKQKSVGVRMVFRSDERTLTDEEINASVEKIVAAVTSSCGAEIRS